VALVHVRNVTLTGDGIEPQRLATLEATPSLLRLLGIDPIFGRVFSEDDDRPGAARKVLLATSLFERVARYLKNSIVGVSARDPSTLLSATAIVMLTALAVSYIPARRAAQVDPMAVLKEE